MPRVFPKTLGKLPLVMLMGILALSGPATAAFGESFSVTNLITSDQSLNPAQITDPSLKNAWGISFAPQGPFWLSSNGGGVSPLYQVDPLTNLTTKLALVVSIPGEGSVTGQVFSGGGGFNNDTFLFASEDGTISGWRNALGTAAEVLQLASADNVYKGLALATVGADKYAYAANFRSGKIDVLKGTSGAPDLGSFTDPALPSGFAPFNIQNIGGKLYVTYALQDAAKKDDVAGAGNGFVSVFDTKGTFIGRVGSHGSLNSPWGLAIAPTSFGSFAGDLLVGNFGDGTINAFDLTTNAYKGQLLGPDGKPLVIDGLWGLSFGNGFRAGSTDTLYFAAGPNEEQAGLFGAINLVPEPGSLVLGLSAAGILGAWNRGRSRKEPS